MPIEFFYVQDGPIMEGNNLGRLALLVNAHHDIAGIMKPMVDNVIRGILCHTCEKTGKIAPSACLIQYKTFRNKKICSTWRILIEPSIPAHVYMLSQKTWK